MSAYRRLVFAFPALILLYCGVVIAEHLMRDGREIFPFFNWSLFSYPQATVGRYTVRVLAVDDPAAPAAKFVGKVVESPRDLLFLQSTDFQKAMQRFLRIRSGRMPGSVELAKELLDNFARDASITSYEIVRLHYDPLEHYFSGTFREFKTIVHLEVGKPL